MEVLAVLIALVGGVAVLAGLGFAGWVAVSLGSAIVVLLYDLTMVPVVGDPIAYRERERKRIRENVPWRGFKEWLQALMKWLNGLVPGFLTVMYVNVDSYMANHIGGREAYQHALILWTGRLHWLIGWLHPIGPLTLTRVVEDGLAAQIVWLALVWAGALAVFLFSLIFTKRPPDLKPDSDGS